LHPESHNLTTTIMPTDTAFRVSTYLTLALSCLCIGYAESDVLPEVGFVAAAAIIALVVLFSLETRIELLSIDAANRLGLIIGLANFVWGAARLMWEREHHEFQNMPWQLMFAAMFGLLLMTLMLAKLARREKHAGDYWALHGMGLVGVILAGAIAEDPMCFLLIVMYAACAAWSLSLFYLRQIGGDLLPISGKPNSTPIGIVIADHNRQLGLRRTTAFILVAAAFAVPLYLITPRSTAEKLSFGQSRVEIGYSADQMTDLNKTGDLKANDAVAFEVTAETNGHPRTDLATDQRWRGRILREYGSGVWRWGDGNHLPTTLPSPLPNRNDIAWSPPNLGEGQCTLTFTVPSQPRAEFLADPIVWARDQPVPVATLTPSGKKGWMWGTDGTFYPNFDIQESNTESIRYLQVWRPEKDPDLSPAFLITESDPDRTLQFIRNNPVPKVKEYADTVLEAMIRERKLPADCRDPIHLLPRREFHDRIARGFSDYLATTPNLTYTTNLRREMKNIDPIEEFLFHTRAGHCERFATALALMLRAEGIPAVLVLGFKGCEPTEEPGKYVVRQEHAHAWVAALIQVFEPAKNSENRRPLSRWRSLDPTPRGSSVAERETVNSGTQPVLPWLRRNFRTYISEYTGEQRRRALVELVTQATRLENLAIAVAVVAGAMLLRGLFSLRRKRPTPVPDPQAKWFARLVKHLKTYGLTLMPGETPLEYATRATNTLQRNPKTVEVSTVPLDWVEAYYESRFGDKPISENRRATLESRLEELIRRSGHP
jgi:protein-glutamine gamma-glutamyltransferase